jgi:hypothetical protein
MSHVLRKSSHFTLEYTDRSSGKIAQSQVSKDMGATGEFRSRIRAVGKFNANKELSSSTCSNQVYILERGRRRDAPDLQKEITVSEKLKQ